MMQAKVSHSLEKSCTKGHGGYLDSRLVEKFSQLRDNFIEELEQVRQKKMFFFYENKMS